MQDPRYPIGKFESKPFSKALKEECILDIQSLPTQLEFAVNGLDAGQLNETYREGGWNVKQVVHHIADSHMNAFIRFRLGLTEDNPTIKPYDENAWATLPDIDHVPINVSNTLLHALHRRWTAMLKFINDEQWERTVFHPEHKKQMTLWYLLQLYAWHGKHHVAHITSLREKMNWNP